ncbi:MAG: sensor histidine kinase [Acidimicrobiaceae bacterium]|nr:sensor histidine kinase [Acidimicrobiaceae bacterium]
MAVAGRVRDQRWRPSRLAALALQIAILVLVIWALTGAGYFWPGWVWLGLAIPFALRGALRRGLRSPRGRALGVQTWVSVTVAAICLAVWFLSGGDYYFWPVWPVVGMGIALAVHSALSPGVAAREKALIDRVGTLTRSRRTALEIQAAELRRVERDLHDGAQARLVSLGMNLGLAEEMIGANPDAARQLLTDARVSAGAALSDLRDLVRGIRPPVLADRGLEAAISALVVTVPIPVELTVDLPGPLPDPVESAVYFAVAETVTNVVKHSGARRAWIRCDHTDGVLTVVVGDDGKGGADPALGSGLAGMEQRLASFDGTLSVVSPLGGPTVVRVEVPCELLSPKT